MQNNIIWAVQCTNSHDWENNPTPVYLDEGIFSTQEVLPPIIKIVKVFSTKEKAADHIKLIQEEIKNRNYKYIRYLAATNSISTDEYIYLDEECIEFPHDECYSIIGLVIE